MPSLHSQKGPSSSMRWINCPGSVHLCADMPDEGSSFAAEGTDAHSLCEYLLKKALGQECTDPRENLTYYDQEMQDSAEGYVQFVMEKVEQARERSPDVLVRVEEEVRYDRFVPGGFGTADALIIADGVLEVIDFKYGKGVQVDGKGNTQMRIYALGALEKFGILYDVDTVRMTIFQPRLSNISEDEIGSAELYEWAENVLKPAAVEADSPDAHFSASEWCRFCKAKHVCRERARKNLELAAYDFKSPPLLTDEEVGRILEEVDELTRWASDVKEYAQQEAVDGKHWPGWKLVEGRSVRKYKDEKAVGEIVEKAGYEAYQKKLLSITEMQKQLGKKKFNELLGDLVEKPQGKPVLVKEDDKRPEMNLAKDDFKED